MTKEKIFQLISGLEKITDSKVIIYYTNDLIGPPFGTVIANDVLSLFKNILRKQGVVHRRTLILHTNGGTLDTAWPLVNLIKEYTKNDFEVIIPSKALSAGTLISLGADKIIMPLGSFLSPIDPTGTFKIKKDNMIEDKTCSVEDIMAYIEFAREKMGLKGQLGLTEALKLITQEYSSSIIGSVNRTHNLIRNLANKLMKIRKQPLTQKEIDSIAKYLIQDLYSHSHLINFDEAKEIGIKYVFRPNKSLETKIFALHNLYKKDLFLEEKTGEIDNHLRNISSIEREEIIKGACVHSADQKYSHNTEVVFAKTPTGTGEIRPVMNIKKQGWIEL